MANCDGPIFRKEWLGKNHSAGAVIFGMARSLSGETISLCVRGPESIAATVLIDTLHGSWLTRMKPDELRKVRDACDKAIEWFEEKERCRKNQP